MEVEFVLECLSVSSPSLLVEGENVFQIHAISLFPWANCTNKNHDKRVLDLFGKWVKHDVPREVVGGHLHLTPQWAKVQSCMHVWHVMTACM